MEGSGVQSWRGEGCVIELAGYVVPTELFSAILQSKRLLFLWSLKNMSVFLGVKDQYQAASHSPVYSGVAEVAVQPAVGVRGGVNARCGPLSLGPPFGKSAQTAKGNIFPVATPCCS